MAGLDLAEFIESVCLACDESKLVTSYDVRIQDNTTVKIRVFLETQSFIDVYFNQNNFDKAVGGRQHEHSATRYPSAAPQPVERHS